MVHIVNDPSVPMLPTPNPSPSLSFEMRFPCTAPENVRRAAQIFCAVRKMSHAIRGARETDFPLRQPEIPMVLRDSISLCEHIGLTLLLILRHPSAQEPFPCAFWTVLHGQSGTLMLLHYM